MQVSGADGIVAKAQIYADRLPADGYGKKDGIAKLPGQTDQGRAGLGLQVHAGHHGMMHGVYLWTQDVLLGDGVSFYETLIFKLFQNTECGRKIKTGIFGNIGKADMTWISHAGQNAACLLYGR